MLCFVLFRFSAHKAFFHRVLLSSSSGFFHSASRSGGVFRPQDSGALPSPSPIRWIRLHLRIQRLHLIEFLGGDLRQVPDEQNQAPGFLSSVHSILNCVVKLAIALVLRPGRTQVGRFRIEALAEPCVAPSVIRMARGAMIGEMLHASPNVLR